MRAPIKALKFAPSVTSATFSKTYAGGRYACKYEASPRNVVPLLPVPLARQAFASSRRIYLGHGSAGEAGGEDMAGLDAALLDVRAAVGSGLVEVLNVTEATTPWIHERFHGSFS